MGFVFMSVGFCETSELLLHGWMRAASIHYIVTVFTSIPRGHNLLCCRVWRYCYGFHKPLNLKPSQTLNP